MSFLNVRSFIQMIFSLSQTVGSLSLLQLLADLIDHY